MKCDNCNDREATCHYRLNINGRQVERHLCGSCAAGMGIERDVFSDFGNLFDDMFSGFFGRRALSPFEDFFGMPQRTMPRLEILLDGCAPTKEQTEEQKHDSAQEGTDPEMSKKRRLNMLRREMKRAASQEDFEKAAELRDQIRELEKS